MDKVSIVVPTVNEAENIARLIPQVEEVLKANGIKGEIIVVDDKSDDGTADETKKQDARYGNVKLIERQVRDGLGNALKRGVKEAVNEYVIFMDADLSHEPKEVPNFVKALKDYDVVVGSRYMRESKLERTMARKLISGTYNIVAKNLLGVRVTDLTSGYRGFRKTGFESLKISSSGPEIHAELIVKASVAGLRVGEIPVSYVDRLHGESKLNYMRIGPGYSKALLGGILSKASKLLRR